MADKPFQEKAAATGAAGQTGGGKSEFEDKVHSGADKGDLKDRVDKRQNDKMFNPKPEKDERADKFAADKSHKDQKDNKAEKSEKDSKDIVKEKDLADGTLDPGKLASKREKLEKDGKDVAKEKDLADGGVFQQETPMGPPGPDPQMLARIAALESTVGQLMHFIDQQLRPDLSRGALQDEPEAEPDDDDSPPS